MHNKKIVLVTGASSGIDEALVRELANSDWMLIGPARSTEKLMNLKNELSASFIPITCDISDKADIRRAYQSILDNGIFPTLFFLNAGIAGEKALEKPESFTVECINASWWLIILEF